MAEQEYWRWTESRHHDESIDPKAGEIVVAGIDVGSVSSQAVITVDNQLYAYSSRRTGSDSPESATKALAWALDSREWNTTWPRSPSLCATPRARRCPPTWAATRSGAP